VIRPERTRHEKEVVEVISEFNLKEKMGLKNGSVVEVEA
jgi:CTP-dependent riboflavin kinase